MLADKRPTPETIYGNVYDKYGTRNPIARWLVRGFDRSMAELLGRTQIVKSILEVGCGEGELTRKLSILFPDAIVRGSDISKDVIAEATKRHPDLHFEVRSVYDLSGEPDTYDLVVASEVLEHLEDPRAALRELASVTRGHMFLSVPREPLWRILNCARAKYLLHLGNTPGHLQHWGAAAFLRFLEREVDVVATRTPVPWMQVLCRRRGK